MDEAVPAEHEKAIDQWACDAKVGFSFQTGIYHATVVARDYLGWMRIRICKQSEELSAPIHLCDKSYRTEYGKVLL
jgi:hypothetical protein